MLEEKKNSSRLPKLIIVKSADEHFRYLRLKILQRHLASLWRAMVLLVAAPLVLALLVPRAGWLASVELHRRPRL
jgi:hypothetical protein